MIYIIHISSFRSSLVVSAVDLIILCCRFTVALVYYGVSYGSVDLGWDRYLTFALTSLVEFPAVFLSVYLAER